MEELEEIPRRVDYPLFANMLTGGATPLASTTELENLGYKVVVCPIESLLLTGAAMMKLCQTWKEEGRVDGLVSREGLSFDQVKELLGVDDFLSLRDQVE